MCPKLAYLLSWYRVWQVTLFFLCLFGSAATLFWLLYFNNCLLFGLVWFFYYKSLTGPSCVFTIRGNISTLSSFAMSRSLRNRQQNRNRKKIENSKNAIYKKWRDYKINNSNNCIVLVLSPIFLAFLLHWVFIHFVFSVFVHTKCLLRLSVWPSTL